MNPPLFIEGVPYVSQECIDAGTRKNCYKCPVALAVLKQWPMASEAIVRGGLIYVDFYKGENGPVFPHLRYKFVMPFEMRNKISVFDTTGDMLPFSFPMKAEVVRAGRE